MGVFLGKTNLIFKTGQTTSYVDYDDGYFQKGITLPTTRFVWVNKDMGSGNTFLDRYSGLFWHKTTYRNYDWQTCMASYLGWNMPNLRELMTLISYGSTGFVTGHLFDGLVAGDNYWSSTTVKTQTTYAYILGPASGTLNIHKIEKTTSLYMVGLRCRAY